MIGIDALELTHLGQQAMDNVFKELTIKDNLSTIGFAIMILNLIKVLQTTRAHPRVGVLVATVIMGCVLKRGVCGERRFELCVGEFADLCLCAYAQRVSMLTHGLILSIDDIIHFGFLFLIVFITFAMTGTWAFGKESEEFATFQKGMTTQVPCTLPRTSIPASVLSPARRALLPSLV